MRLNTFISLSLTLCFIEISGRCTAAAVLTSPDVVAQERQLNRIVRDAASIQLDEITPDQTWVVAKVKPNINSPSSEDIGFYFDSKTRQFVREPGQRKRTVITEWGTIEPLVSLSGIPSALVNYRWSYDSNPRIRLSQISIFSGGLGGTAMFRVNDGVEGKDKFKPIYRLFDEWVPFIQPAFIYVQKNKATFYSDKVSQHREQLQQLLSDPNPFLAIAAARMLGEVRGLDETFVKGPLIQAVGLQQSVFTFLLIQQLPRIKQLNLGADSVTPQKLNETVSEAIAAEQPVKELGDLIDTAKNTTILKDITVGLAALLNSPESTIFTQARVANLLQRVSKRQKALGTHTQADAYLDASPTMIALGQQRLTREN